MSLFVRAIEPYTEIVRDREYRCGIRPVDYYPPSLEARLEEDSIVLHYGDVVRSIYFKDIRRVKLNMMYQLVMVNGKRLGLLGMGREDVERIRTSHQNYRTGDAGSGLDTELSVTELPSGGVLTSESGLTGEAKNGISEDS